MYRYGIDWSDENSVAKSSSFAPNSVKHEIVPPEDYSYSQDDQASRSNTPSMIYCSSRSASSSIIACGPGACVSQCCNCQDVSDTESCRIQQGGIESPRILPIISSPSKKIDGLNPTSLYALKRAGFSLPINKRPSPTKEPFLAENSGIESNKSVDELPIPKPGNSNEEMVVSSSMTDAIPSSKSPHSQMADSRARLDDESESENGDEEVEDDDDDDDESDEDDWSGQDDDLEARVLEALGNDLPLAAHLIPLLHKVLYSVFSRNITRKVGPWRYDVTKYGTETGTTSSGKTLSSNAPTNGATNDQKKRHRNIGSDSRDREEDDGDDDDEDEDERNRDPKRLKDDTQMSQYPRLACPFHKLDPNKYGIQHETMESGKKADYRICAGPGFKSIQRLKEHLKRKHYPVQCERCYQIFEGPDRAARALGLENHRQLLEPCRRNSSSLKEGISDAQWASLDKKKSNKKNQSSSNVEKWNDIWVILFPDSPVPGTPWYDERLLDRPPPTPSEGSNEFIGLLRHILNHQINHGDIELEEEMLNRVLNAARKAFQTWSATCRSQASFSSGNSSSARSLPQSASLLGGSYQQIAMPSIGKRQRSATSVSTAIRSQAYSADMSGSPTGSSMHPRRRQSENIVPNLLSSFMEAQHVSHVSFENNIIQPRFPHGPPVPPQFDVGLTENMNHFMGNAFDGSNVGNPEDPWLNYDGPGAGFDNRGPAPPVNGASFSNSNGGIDPSSTLLNSPENTLQNLNGIHAGWANFHAPAQSHYAGGQP